MFRNSIKYSVWLVITGYCCLSGFIYSCGTQKERAKLLLTKGCRRLPCGRICGVVSCAECHAEALQKWEESHHYHAMELPGPETVRQIFNNTEFINYGVTTKFFMEGDKFMVETNNQKEMEVFEIAYAF